ncbi:MAG: hypothetical protein NTZ72_04575, partial [Afipia sp.]|nr:hypothetical protein [Afipia sp.]
MKLSPDPRDLLLSFYPGRRRIYRQANALQSVCKAIWPVCHLACKLQAKRRLRQSTIVALTSSGFSCCVQWPLP